MNLQPNKNWIMLPPIKTADGHIHVYLTNGLKSIDYLHFPNLASFCSTVYMFNTFIEHEMADARISDNGSGMSPELKAQIEAILRGKEDEKTDS